MDAEPDIPLPKENDGKPLFFVQLIMLWLFWTSGMAASGMVFLGELMSTAIARRLRPMAGPRQVQGIAPVHQMAWKNQELGIASITELK